MSDDHKMTPVNQMMWFLSIGETKLTDTAVIAAVCWNVCSDKERVFVYNDFGVYEWEDFGGFSDKPLGRRIKTVVGFEAMDQVQGRSIGGGSAPDPEGHIKFLMSLKHGHDIIWGSSMKSVGGSLVYQMRLDNDPDFKPGISMAEYVGMSK